jgi:ParB family chromosome partitioning protein
MSSANTQTKSAALPRGSKAKPTPLPGLGRASDHVAGLMEPDLSGIRPNRDREQMELRTVGKSTVVASPVRIEALSPVDLIGDDGVQHLVVGNTYRLALHMLQDSQFNARVYYSAAEIDSMAVSLQENGQDVALSGFVDGSKVTVVDGSKRLRAARAASLDSLRVEIKERPASNKETYKASRRMNIERSTQTPLDDAVRWAALLEADDYPDQTSLGKDNGVSQTVVSQTLSLNRIPQTVMRVMREEHVQPVRDEHAQPKLCQLSFAVEIAKMFDGTHKEGQEQEDKAIEVIREIVAKDLSVKQARALVQSRLDGPKARQKAETMAVRYGNGLGTLKVFAAKGQLDLSIKNVDPAKIGDLRAKIEELFTAKSAG